MEGNCLVNKEVSAENISYFEKNGVLILRNVISPEV
jgi:hypothetical protein